MSRVIVFHAGYGCDTGCCGHVIRLEGAEPGDEEEVFSFSHPSSTYPDWELSIEQAREWAENLVRNEMGEEHVADLDWEHCVIVDD